MTGTHAPGALLPGAWVWSRRWRAPTLQLAVVLAVLGADLALVAGARADLRAEGGAGPVVAVEPVAAAASPPVRLGIPALGLTTRLIGVRKEPSGALGVPDDPQRAAWYSQGPAPGDAGSAVIVGHVDSRQGPGIFAELRDLSVGARIDVRRADGSLARFVVTRVEQYPKRDFPTAAVYAVSGPASLRLVTCGGEFDRRSGHYRSNVIVFAEAV